MDLETRSDLQSRLEQHLSTIGVRGAISFINAGASAAVFRVHFDDGTRAFKVFDPSFFTGDGEAAERRRLELQRSLIGHDCPQLVQAFTVTEASGTAIIEMEYVDWPRLSDTIADIPTESIPNLINQLVQAVMYLESRDIVHRDIKPDNIHVSPGFDRLILLDLGVAREFELPDDQDAAATDQSRRRPFLATAQYSSPEYLFRLDEPNRRLWHGLNLYQVGAVLHDLILGRALFADEIEVANKWLVARAVLLKQPSLDDGNPERLVYYKGLAARALSKDIDVRLRSVTWDDFDTSRPQDQLMMLRSELDRRDVASAGVAVPSTEFERHAFLTRIAEQTRARIVATTGPQLPCTLVSDHPDPGSGRFTLTFSHSDFAVVVVARFDWLDGVNAGRAVVSIGSVVQFRSTEEVTLRTFSEVALGENEALLIEELSGSAALFLRNSLFQADAADDVSSLAGFDLGSLGIR